MDDKWLVSSPVFGALIYALALISTGLSAYYGMGFLPTMFAFLAAFTSGHSRELFDLQVVETRPYFKGFIPFTIMIMVGIDLFYAFTKSQPYTEFTLVLQVFLIVVAIVNPLIGEATLQDELEQIMSKEQETEP